MRTDRPHRRTDGDPGPQCSVVVPPARKEPRARKALLVPKVPKALPVARKEPKDPSARPEDPPGSGRIRRDRKAHEEPKGLRTGGGPQDHPDHKAPPRVLPGS